MSAVDYARLYQHDATFHALVSWFVQVVRVGQLSVENLRGAVDLAEQILVTDDRPPNPPNSANLAGGPR